MPAPQLPLHVVRAALEAEVFGVNYFPNCKRCEFSEPTGGLRGRRQLGAASRVKVF